MGQRLNIEIVKNGKVLANGYYHWSAYTSSAINITTKIIQCFDYIKRNLEDTKDNDLLFAIRLLEETGAGLDSNEMRAARERLQQHDFKFKECKSRNEGIIAVTEKEITDTRFWEEGRVTIDIETKKVNFNVFHFLSEEEIKEYAEETESKIQEINIDFENIDFIKIFDIKAFIEKSNYEDQYYFKNIFNNEYLSFIE